MPGEATLFEIDPVFVHYDRVGRVFSKTKTSAFWQFNINEKTHEIRLTFSSVSRKVRVTFDGMPVFQGAWPDKAVDWEFAFSEMRNRFIVRLVDAHPLQFLLEINGFNFDEIENLKYQFEHNPPVPSASVTASGSASGDGEASHAEAAAKKSAIRLFSEERPAAPAEDIFYLFDELFAGAPKTDAIAPGELQSALSAAPRVDFSEFEAVQPALGRDYSLPSPHALQALGLLPQSPGLPPTRAPAPAVPDMSPLPVAARVSPDPAVRAATSLRRGVRTLAPTREPEESPEPATPLLSAAATERSPLSLETICPPAAIYPPPPPPPPPPPTSMNCATAVFPTVTQPESEPAIYAPPHPATCRTTIYPVPQDAQMRPDTNAANPDNGATSKPFRGFPAAPPAQPDADADAQRRPPSEVDISDIRWIQQVIDSGRPLVMDH